MKEKIKNAMIVLLGFILIGGLITIGILTGSIELDINVSSDFSCSVSKSVWIIILSAALLILLLLIVDRFILRKRSL